jgi:dTDP-4-dehydrorhamnose 3,5-epimerase
MRFTPTRIAGVTIVELEPSQDARGSFARTFCAEAFAAAGIPFEVVQVNLSSNRARHTLRGLHYQRAPFGEPKIVACLRGRIFDVVVDVRPNSPTYLQWEGVELSFDGGRMLCLSEGIAHGFLTLEPDSEVQYLMGAAYRPEAAAGLRWNDPALAIEWPAEPAAISERDRNHPLLRPEG